MNKQLFSFPISIWFLIFSFFIICNVEAGRPLGTDDTGVVGVGIVELETAYAFSDSTDDEHSLSVVLSTGLLEKLDIGVELPYNFIDVADGDNQDGISDIGITTKWNFYANDDDVEGTLSFNYKSDNGDDENGLGTGAAEYSILGIISKQLSDVTVHLNIGPTIIKGDQDVFNYLTAAEWGVSEQLTLVAEIYGTTTFEGNIDSNSLSGLGGLTYAVGDSVVFDLGVSFGISDADPDYGVTSGLTFEFGG